MRFWWFGAAPNLPACQPDRDLEVNCQLHARDRTIRSARRQQEWRKGRPNDDRSKEKKNVHSECEEGGGHLRKWNRRAHVRDSEGAEWREKERERERNLVETRHVARSAKSVRFPFTIPSPGIPWYELKLFVQSAVKGNARKKKLNN